MDQLLTQEQRRQIAKLRFPPELEARFWLDWADRIRGPVQKISIAGLALCGLFIAATLILASEEGRQTNFLSVGAVIPILLLTFWLTKTKAWIKINPLPLWLIVTAMAVANGYSMVTMESANYERALIADWMFFFVIVIGSGLALVRSAAVALGLLLGGYLLMAFYVRPIGMPALTSTLMVVGQTVLFAFTAAYIAEIRARREFLLAFLLDQERHKTEQLLSNVLPQQIAQRLKESPGALAERHEDASVLFADIVGFTPYASTKEPDEIIGFLDEVFSHFDHLVEKHGLEKIKTVGDAYMVAGGVLGRTDGHIEDIANLALDIQAHAKATGFSMRIGLHSGPLVAGVIGKSKFLYDLWGETVNTASRMESHGITDQIQVTKSLATRLDDKYLLEPRGLVDVKGIGEIETFLLKGRLEPQIP